MVLGRAERRAEHRAMTTYPAPGDRALCDGRPLLMESSAGPQSRTRHFRVEIPRSRSSSPDIREDRECFALAFKAGHGVQGCGRGPMLRTMNRGLPALSLARLSPFLPKCRRKAASKLRARNLPQTPFEKRDGLAQAAHGRQSLSSNRGNAGLRSGSRQNHMRAVQWDHRKKAGILTRQDKLYRETDRHQAYNREGTRGPMIRRPPARPGVMATQRVDGTANPCVGCKIAQVV